MSAYRPSDGYVSWLRGYITSDSVVQVHGVYPTPLGVLPGVHDLSLSHRCLMYLLITSAFLLNTLDIFLFATADKIFHTVSSVADSTLQQSDTDSLHGWCAADGMKLNVYKTRVTTFTRKTDALNYKYKLCGKYVTRIDSITWILNFFFTTILTTYFLNHSKC